MTTNHHQILFLLTFFVITGINSYHLSKYDPKVSCRSEDGFHICRSIRTAPSSNITINDSICVDRSKAFYHCFKQFDKKFQCTDDEVDCESGCVKRENVADLCKSPLSETKLRCHEDEFKCLRTHKCIPRRFVRDDKDQCTLNNEFTCLPEGDSSDEDNPLDECDKETEFRCPDSSRRCILREMVRDGEDDCKSKGDEKTSLECYDAKEFRCNTSGRCILRYRVNDGFKDCIDGSDENIDRFSCLETEFTCKEKRCIPRSWVRNSIKDCESGEDEITQVKGLLDEEFQCLNGQRILPTKYLCDGILNCKDGSDEIDLCDENVFMHCKELDIDIFNLGMRVTERNLENFRTEGIKACKDLVFGFKCYVETTNDEQNSFGTRKEIRTIPQTSIKNNIPICSDKEDQCYNDQNQLICSRCLDNKTIISKSQICDHIIDCPDLSDECSCEQSNVESLCKLFFPINTEEQLKSADLSFDKICNYKMDMQDNLDEEFCNYEILNLIKYDRKGNDKFKSYKCASHDTNKKLLSNEHGKLCDGVVDCHFKDDECSSQCFERDLMYLFNTEYFNGLNVSSKAKKITTCFPFIRIKDTDFWNRFHVIIEKSYEKYVQELYFIDNYKSYKDENFIISEESEINKSLKPIQVWLDLEEKVPDEILNRDIYTLELSVEEQWTYFNKISDFCNLKRNICPWMFYCNSATTETIDLNKLCDFNVDCKDGSDEMSCSKSSHFYCWKGNPKFIKKSKLLDGKKDCLDGSDECIDDEFSSPYEMLKSGILRFYVWFSSFITLSVNAVVIITHLNKLKKSHNRNSFDYVNLILLCQLAFSDLIMGFALLIVGIKSVEYSGEYCYHDLAWRTSSLCNTIGVIVVTSSQTSISMLVIITALRLYLVRFPLKANHVNYKKFSLIALSAWLLCFLYALLPVFLENQMAESFYIESNPFVSGQAVSYRILENFYKRTQIIPQNYANFSNLKTTTDNFSINKLLNEYHNSEEGRLRFPYRQINIKKVIGYYSSSAVCFPSLYTDQSSFHFSFSFIMIFFNTLALLFICGTYLRIFHLANSNIGRNNKKDNRMLKLKKRILYIILTDTLCWLPIIIMSFMSYSGLKLVGEVNPVSAIVILPINSAINPLIYSRLDKYIKRFFRKVVLNKKEFATSEINHTSRIAETYA